MSWLTTLLKRLDNELFAIGNTHVTPMSFVIFFLTIAVAIVAGHLARRAIRRYFGRKESAEGIAHALERMVQIVAVALGVVIGLQNVGIDLTALAAVGAMLSVGIGFGLQGVAQNFISGIALLIERPVQKGDFVIIGDTVGEVHEIRMRATRIVTRDSVAIIVPNNELMTERVINMSRPGSVYRAKVKLTVAYGSDVERVRDTLLEVVAGHGEVLDKPEPDVFFLDFGDSGLEFAVTVWLDDAEHEPRILSELRFAIDRAFRSANITIPFPQRDLHLKSSNVKFAS